MWVCTWQRFARLLDLLFCNVRPGLACYWISCREEAIRLKIEERRLLEKEKKRFAVRIEGNLVVQRPPKVGMAVLTFTWTAATFEWPLSCWLGPLLAGLNVYLPGAGYSAAWTSRKEGQRAAVRHLRDPSGRLCPGTAI